MYSWLGLLHYRNIISTVNRILRLRLTSLWLSDHQIEALLSCSPPISVIYADFFNHFEPPPAIQRITLRRGLKVNSGLNRIRFLDPPFQYPGANSLALVSGRDG